MANSKSDVSYLVAPSERTSLRDLRPLIAGWKLTYKITHFTPVRSSNLATCQTLDAKIHLRRRIVQDLDCREVRKALTAGSRGGQISSIQPP